MENRSELRRQAVRATAELTSWPKWLQQAADSPSRAMRQDTEPELYTRRSRPRQRRERPADSGEEA